MEPTIWVNSIKFKNGLDLPLKKNSIVVFVGPNNSGKSLTLREIASLTNGHSQTSFVIENLEMSASGSSSDFLKKIENRRKGTTYHYLTNNHSGMDGNNLSQFWDQLVSGKNSASSAISNFFVKAMDTANRLNLVSPAGNIDFINELRTHPIHVLKEDSDKELLFSSYFKLAFGEDVIVNHGAGANVPLHVGERPIVTAENDRVSTFYQKILRQLPVLHEQGDGMKSFAGVFLTLFAEDFSVNLIDEPEAFLHPPQAALLGQMIAQKLGEDKQLFIATHSEHFLKGLIDSATERLVIVRIQRNGANNNINILENKELKDIWSDSILRHSNILDGLFHKKVVLVESDSDCRFYNAFTTAIIEHLKVPSPDILFIQSGGKHRFPVVIKALKNLEVPLTIIGDFDFYHDENPTRFIFEELGGNWDDIKIDFKKVKKAIDEKRPELEADALNEEIKTIFDSFTDKVIPEGKIKEIQAALKRSSPWSQAKASGKAYLPAGEATLAFNRLQKTFAEKNIHILEMGEIEAFDKSIGGHGPKWVNHVLEKDLMSSSELEEARKFVHDNIIK